MTLLKKSDLQSANSSGTFMSALISDQEDAQELINSIQDFISSSTDYLKGDAYDAVRAHLETYIPILQTRIKVANSIMEAIKAANNSMIDYMEGEDTLDTAELEGLRLQYNAYRGQAERSLASANAYITPEAKSQAMAEYERCSALAREVNKKIQLLENLDSQDNAVYASLASIEAEITAFKNAVSDINAIKYTTK